MEKYSAIASRIRGLIFFQILVVLVVIATIVINNHDFINKESSLSELQKTLNDTTLVDLESTWLYDSELLIRSSEEYDKDILQRAYALSLASSLFIGQLEITLNEQGENTQKLDSLTTEFGQFTQRINRLRQSIIRLNRIAQNGRLAGDFRISEFEAYSEYLQFEKEINDWGKTFGYICKIGAIISHQKKSTPKNDSFISKLIHSEKVKELTDWAISNLKKQSDKAGDFTTILEASPTNPEERSQFNFFLKIFETEESLDFKTLRDYTKSSSYIFVHQENFSSNTIDSIIIPTLTKYDLNTTFDFKNYVRREKENVESLKSDQRVSFPVVGSMIPISMLIWLLPILNFVLLAILFRQKRYKLSLLKEEQISLETIETNKKAWAYHFILSKSDQYFIIWDIIRDTIGIFGMSIVTVMIAIGMHEGKFIVSTREIIILLITIVIAVIFIAAFWYQWISIKNDPKKMKPLIISLFKK